MSAAKPVLIAGGGIASLLLAQSLRNARIPFIIYERDASFTFRAQGYRLRLSSEGLDAIESVLDAGLWSRFWDACGKTGGNGLITLDAVTGERTEKIVEENLQSRGGKVVGISRGEMRQFFSEGCTDHIQWSRNVTAYEVTRDGVRAVFADGTKSVEGSLLVGGDGFSSKIARQVSEGRIKVYDTGARGIHGQSPTAAFKPLGEGVFRVTDKQREGGVFLMTNVRPQDMNNPDVKFGWGLSGQPGVIRAPNDEYSIIGKQAAELTRSVTEHWHPHFRRIIDEMDEDETAFWKITCSRPSGVPHWPNEPRVTVIGDAAHAMTPAGGNGANTAILDSALLGRLLREAGGYKDGITAAYEAEMRKYASDAVLKSYELASSVFQFNIDEDSGPTV